MGGDSGAGEISLARLRHGATRPPPWSTPPSTTTHDAGAVSLIAGAANTQTRGEYFVDRVIVGENDQDTLFDFGPNAETDGGTTPLTVEPGNLQGWQHQAYDDVDYLNSNQEFVAGPATPPLGDGSLKMSLSTD